MKMDLMMLPKKAEELIKIQNSGKQVWSRVTADANEENFSDTMHAGCTQRSHDTS